jgi:hypothetical protein
MDIDRVKYSLTKYLRIRILKIQQMYRLILSNFELMERLSKEEKVFVTKLSNLNNTFYDETFYHRLSENIKESIENSDDCLKHSQVSLYVRPPPCNTPNTFLHLIPFLSSCSF